MKKILIIVLALTFLGLIAFWIFIGFDSKSSPTDTSGGNVTLPSSNTVPGSTSNNPAQGQSSVTGVDGTIIPTRDFLSAPTTGEYPNRGYFYLGYHTAGDGVVDATATNDPPYLIEYISATQYFNIGLFKEPIGTVRSNAEQFLMAELGISQDQMCHLKYMVSVPSRVNSQFASRNLGFSFCPGATALPK